ncbi:MAG TPA: hypothetical protein VLK33_21110 [Terriglobales bacterium]|nr:hypothetical protein [Terriglobales bacterium]
MEVFGGGSVAVLEDFRRLELSRDGRKQVFKSHWRQDKGHRGEWEAFAAGLREGTGSPIPFVEIVSTTLATIRVVESQATGKSVPIDVAGFIRANAHLQRSDS